METCLGIIADSRKDRRREDFAAVERKEIEMRWRLPQACACIPATISNYAELIAATSTAAACFPQLIKPSGGRLVDRAFVIVNGRLTAIAAYLPSIGFDGANGFIEAQGRDLIAPRWK
jgi:hypothetical protein